MTTLARSSALARIGRSLIAAFLVLALCPQVARAQDADPAEMLEDFVHYARIARTDLASASAQELLASGVTNAELAVMVEAKGTDFQKRFDLAIGRAVLVAELEDLAGEIGVRVEHGRMDLAREERRIMEAIQMLTGTQRQKMLGTGRLEAAGEYAVPLLLQEITDGHDERLKLACTKMLAQIGVQSVTPLSIALVDIDPQSQQTVCGILGKIGYRHAAPYLRDLSADAGTDGPARDAAERAFREVKGIDEDLSLQFSALARQYYDRQQSLVAFPFEETNNVWTYEAHGGLVLIPVPTVVFEEIMAMRLTAKALALDPTNREALSLYVAANLKRENDLPLGASDPVYGEANYTPEFFATVFGTDVCQDVLALALDTNDTLLVRDAIAALAQTTGGSNLFTNESGRQPLLEALNYPDRRVQYEAALTLAHALPDKGFDGDYRVVPILASAVRMGEQSFALVVSDDEENRRQAMIALEGNTFTIAGAESSVAALSGAIADAPGIDLVTVRMNNGSAARTVVEDIRRGTKTAAAPILIVAPAVDAPGLDMEFRGDPQIKIARPGIGGAAFTNALNELLERAAGGRLTEAEAEAYAFEALGALEDVAISQSPAYTLADAETSLLEALSARSGRARLLVASILARIDSDATQHALFDAAITASGGEQIDLLDQVAASIKRFGDHAEKRHLLNILDLIENSGGSTAEAAARVHGSMNLATTDAVRLIVEKDG